MSKKEVVEENNVPIIEEPKKHVGIFRTIWDLLNKPIFGERP